MNVKKLILGLCILVFWSPFSSDRLSHVLAGPPIFGGSNVGTDPIWDAAGDLAVGTGDNTATKLPIGTPYQLIQTNAAGTFPEWTSLLSILTFNLPSSAGSPATTIGQAKHNSTTNRFEMWDGIEVQEMPSVQSSRVITQYDNATTTLGNITGLTASVAAARTYSFRAVLFTTSNVAGGVKVAMSGGCTATSIVYEVLITNAGLITQGRGAALDAAVGVTAVTVAMVTIEGLITVANAGTLTVQLAQNGGPVGTTSALVGSNFHVTYIQ